MIMQINTQSFSSALEYAADFCLHNQGKNIDIVVPDKLSLFMERFIFEKLNITSSFNIKVSTLNRYAKRNLLIDKSKQISKTGAIILINKILNENKDRFSVIKNDYFSFSYAENIFKTIYQLKASNIGFKEMQNFSSSNLQLMGKIQDLALVYSEYETQKAGLIDASDMFLMSVFSIEQNRQDNKILFVGFDDFTSIEYSLIEKLAINCDVSVVHYCSKQTNNYIYNTEIPEQLKHIAMFNTINYQVTDYIVQTTPVKQFLADNLFGLTNNQYLIKDDEIKIIPANSVEAELELVARDIRTQVLQGKKYSDFGVAIFDIVGKTDIIQQIFKKYDINYYLDMPLSLNRSVVYKFIQAVFKFNIETNNLMHVIDIINSPFCLLEEQAKHQITQYLLVMQFKGKNLDNVKMDNMDKELQYLSMFLKSISFTPKTELKKVKQIITSINFEQVITQLVKQGDLAAQVLLNKSKEIVFDLFDEVENFYPDADVKIFYDIFINIASVVEINNLPLTLDTVKIVDANNYAESFNHLYLLNCTNENAPAIKADCGIILDSEIQQLNFAHKLAPTIAHINKLTRLRLYNSVLLFNANLTICYNKTQSIVIKELCKKIQVKDNKIVHNITPTYSFNHGMQTVLSTGDYIETIHKYSRELDNTTVDLPQDKNFEVLPESALEIYNNLNKVSATYLENYFKCPFYAFMSNTLKIKQRLESEILMLDIGNILHEIIYKYYKNNKKEKDIYNFAKTEIFAYIKKEPRLQINLTSPIITQLIEEVIRVINGLNYIDQNSLFVPKMFEYQFDENAVDLDNVHLIGKVDRIDEYLQDDVKKFRIIDYKSQNADPSIKELYYGKKLQLFLYNVAIEKSLKILGVGSFYLPLHNKYENIQDNRYSLIGFYQNEEDIIHALDTRLQPGQKSDIVNVTMSNDGVAKKYGNKALTKAQLDMLKKYSIDVSTNAVKEIKSGYIKPSPLGIKSPCNYCPYAQVCLKDSNAVVERGTADVSLDSFKDKE